MFFSESQSTHFWFAAALLYSSSASIGAMEMFEFIEVIVPGVWSAALWAQEVPASGCLDRE